MVRATDVCGVRLALALLTIPTLHCCEWVNGRRTWTAPPPVILHRLLHTIPYHTMGVLPSTQPVASLGFIPASFDLACTCSVPYVPYHICHAMVGQSMWPACRCVRVLASWLGTARLATLLCMKRNKREGTTSTASPCVGWLAQSSPCLCKQQEVGHMSLVVAYVSNKRLYTCP